MIHRHITSLRLFTLFFMLGLTLHSALAQDVRLSSPDAGAMASEMPEQAQNGINHLSGKLIRGDVNSDGYINMSDVTAVINYILGKSSGTFVLAAADTDSNGLINLADLTDIINYILYGAPTDPDNPSLPTGDPEGADPGTGL